MLPLHATALGKAAIAYLEDEAVEELLAGRPRPPDRAYADRRGRSPARARVRSDTRLRSRARGGDPRRGRPRCRDLCPHGRAGGCDRHRRAPRAHPPRRTRACAGDTIVIEAARGVSRDLGARAGPRGADSDVEGPAAAYPPHENSNPPHRRAADARRPFRRGLAPRVGVERGGRERRPHRPGHSLGRLRPGSRRALVRRREPRADRQAALSANAAEMRRVLAAPRTAGGTDLKTQSVSLSPRYDERNEVQAFVATNTVSATITEIAKAGALIDAAVSAGEPGLRAVALPQRPERALPQRAQGGGGRRPGQRAGARSSVQPRARPHHRGRRGRPRRSPSRSPPRRRWTPARRRSSPAQQVAAAVTVTFSVSALQRPCPRDRPWDMAGTAVCPRPAAALG